MQLGSSGAAGHGSLTLKMTPSAHAWFVQPSALLQKEPDGRSCPFSSSHSGRVSRERFDLGVIVVKASQYAGTVGLSGTEPLTYYGDCD